MRTNPGHGRAAQDVARIELGAKTERLVGRYNGKPGGRHPDLPGCPAPMRWPSPRRARGAAGARALLPEDVAYDVMYDTTVFVEATIDAVVHTLIEAFVLVGIVVFVFLGNLRATLIPIIAVPVALIGTFAVMLALGFSANTVSLLAWCWRSASSSTTPSSSSRPSSTSSRRSPSSRRPRPPRRRWARSPGRSSPSPWCCSGVRARRPSSRASPASSTSSSPWRFRPRW